MKQDYDLLMKEINEMKAAKEAEIAQLSEKWQAERDSLVQEKALLGRRFGLMESALYGHIEV